MGLVPHVREALLVQAAGDLLRMPHQTTASALVFLHRARAALRQPDVGADLANPPDAEVGAG